MQPAVRIALQEMNSAIDVLCADIRRKYSEQRKSLDPIRIGKHTRKIETSVHDTNAPGRGIKAARSRSDHRWVILIGAWAGAIIIFVIGRNFASFWSVEPTVQSAPVMSWYNGYLHQNGGRWLDEVAHVDPLPDKDELLSGVTGGDDISCLLNRQSIQTCVTQDAAKQNSQPCDRLSNALAIALGEMDTLSGSSNCSGSEFDEGPR
jgi:hypothetical protein